MTGANAQATMDIKVTGTANYTEILTNLISLYTNPWFIMAILMTFGVGMITYMMLKTYRPKNFWVTNQLIIIFVELLFGYLATRVLVEHPNENRLALITGFNAAVLYWIIDYAALRFGLVRIRAFIRFKKVIKDKDGKDIMGQTIQFRSKRK